MRDYEILKMHCGNMHMEIRYAIKIEYYYYIGSYATEGPQKSSLVKIFD